MIMSCAFYGCHRMRELMQKNGDGLFDWWKIIKQASLISKNGYAQYHLPYHKGDPFYCGTDILFTSQDVTDPISLLQEYVAQHDGHHGARATLFLRENGSHPTQSWFDMKFFTILDRRFGGHSPCAGYTTFLASLGVSETIIQAIGRWSSKVWKIYVQENPSIRAHNSWLQVVCSSMVDKLTVTAPRSTSLSHLHHPHTHHHQNIL
jgi:hypothetical protein